MLELWSSAEDDIRIAALLAIRRLSQSNDEAITESVLKVRAVLHLICTQTHAQLPGCLSDSCSLVQENDNPQLARD